MPYKQIAAHLRKTELACRLHYHQVCHSSNRNKTKSISSASSPESPMFGEQYHGNRDSPITSPEPSTPYSAMRSPHQTSRQYALSKHMSNTRDAKHLHLDLHSRSTVDMEKLGSIYEHYKGAFWKLIGAEYGDGADAATLERSWRHGYPIGPHSPRMTPIDSALIPTTANSMPDSAMHSASDLRPHNLMPPPYTGIPDMKGSNQSIFTPPAHPASSSSREMLTLPPLNGSATPVPEGMNGQQSGSRSASRDVEDRRSSSPSSASGQASLPRINEVLMS